MPSSTSTTKRSSGPVPYTGELPSTTVTVPAPCFDVAAGCRRGARWRWAPLPLGGRAGGRRAGLSRRRRRAARCGRGAAGLPVRDGGDDVDEGQHGGDGQQRQGVGAPAVPPDEPPEPAAARAVRRAGGGRPVRAGRPAARRQAGARGARAPGVGSSRSSRLRAGARARHAHQVLTAGRRAAEPRRAARRCVGPARHTRPRGRAVGRGVLGEPEHGPRRRLRAPRASPGARRPPGPAAARPGRPAAPRGQAGVDQPVPVAPDDQRRRLHRAGHPPGVGPAQPQVGGDQGAELRVSACPAHGCASYSRSSSTASSNRSAGPAWVAEARLDQRRGPAAPG